MLQEYCGTSRHSMTSSLLGAAPVTSQKTFWPVLGPGTRSSQNGATSVALCVVGIGSLENSMKGAVKFTLPLLLTKSVVKLPSPNRIGKGDVICADESSLRLRLVPAIVLQLKAAVDEL